VANQGDPIDSPAEAATIEVSSDAPDSFDKVLKKIVATKEHGADLAPGTVIANRFRIEKMIGAGGMGTVYQAHDQTLARDVAIKLHHAAGGAVRLRREAVAMARLAHPNVVSVYEAGEHDGHPFVVMEYITGTTLRAWLVEKPRTVAEIIDIMLDAGRGLAAAHDAGLLHRDIKPENVLIGADGRARVGDFGLARDVDSKEDPPLEGAARILSPMTQTGAMLGTPAYMAPEQLTGETIDARADQFAFCVTMWEALWKQRPYQGANFDELVKALETGKRRPPPSTPKVPAKIRAALERGLATDRNDRFSSMHTLLAALKLPIRRYALAGGALAAAIAAGGVWFAMRPAATPSCDRAGDDLDALIPSDLPAKMRVVGAEEGAKLVSASLSQFHANMHAAAREVCTHKREWTPAIVAKSDACMRIVLRGAAQEIAFDKVTREQVPDIIRRVNLAIPEFFECTSPTTLASGPANPTDAKQLEALITALTDAHVLLVTLDEAPAEQVKQHLDRLESSSMREWPTVKTQLMLVHAKQALEKGEGADAVREASNAYYAARAVDDDVALIQALLMLISVGENGMDRTTLQTWIRTAVADAERVSKRTPSGAGALYVMMANLADTNGDAKQGLELIKLARAQLRPDSEMSRQTDSVEASLLMSTGETEKGKQLFEKTIADQSARLGPEHPMVATMLSVYSANLLNADRYEEALAAAQRAVAILEKAPDVNDLTYDAARGNLASALTWLDREKDALPVLESLREHYVTHHGARGRQVLDVDKRIATASNAVGDFARGEAMFNEALAIQTEVDPKDDEVAYLTLDLASTHRKAGHLDKAFELGRGSADLFRQRRPGSDSHRRALGFTAEVANARKDYASALALTKEGLALTSPNKDPEVIARLKLQRAKALLATHRATGTRQLLDEARVIYEAKKATDRVQEIDSLLSASR
jgi:eukaryotic-like serine/threonine-protein kinase